MSTWTWHYTSQSKLCRILKCMGHNCTYTTLARSNKINYFDEPSKCPFWSHSWRFWILERVFRIFLPRLWNEISLRYQNLNATSKWLWPHCVIPMNEESMKVYARGIYCNLRITRIDNTMVSFPERPSRYVRWCSQTTLTTFWPFLLAYLPLDDIGEGIPLLLKGKICKLLTFSLPSADLVCECPLTQGSNRYNIVLCWLNSGEKTAKPRWDTWCVAVYSIEPLQPASTFEHQAYEFRF